MHGRHTRYWRDWSSDVCSSDLGEVGHVVSEQPTRSIADKGETAQQADDARGGGGGFDLARLGRPPGHPLESQETYPEEGANGAHHARSEERRVGKECRYAWTAYEILA